MATFVCLDLVPSGVGGGVGVGCGGVGVGGVGVGGVGVGGVGVGGVGVGGVGVGGVGVGGVGVGGVGLAGVGIGGVGVGGVGVGVGVDVDDNSAAFWANVEASLPNCKAVSSAFAKAAAAFACVAAKPVMSLKDCLVSVSNAAFNPVGSGAVGAFCMEMIGAGNAVGVP